MLAAPNALMMTGGATTVMEALEVLPVPPSVEVTCTLLFFTPAVVRLRSLRPCSGAGRQGAAGETDGATRTCRRCAAARVFNRSASPLPDLPAEYP